jgi:hypothetical protein
MTKKPIFLYVVADCGSIIFEIGSRISTKCILLDGGLNEDCPCLTLTVFFCYPQIQELLDDYNRIALFNRECRSPAKLQYIS